MVRVAVFIDGGYFSKVMKVAFKSTKIDLEKFSDILCEGCERLRTYYYDCMPYQSDAPTEEQSRRYAAHDKFIYNLRRLRRFEVRLAS